MIPVLIAPAYNRHDMLVRMLRSVDVPVGCGLVIDNRNDLAAAPEWDAVREQMDRLNLRLFTPPFTSIGYGGAINFGITQTPDAPWWLWASNDVEFHPGHLATVVERMNATYAPRIVTGGFTWGAVNRALIGTVGLVDDWSFFPIYYDDNDYQHRCKVAGIEWIEDWSTGTTHGDGRHGASLTIASDADVRRANDRSFQANDARYRSKWGGSPREERFDSPWNSGWPVWVTRPDIDGRRDRRW